MALLVSLVASSASDVTSGSVPSCGLLPSPDQVPTVYTYRKGKFSMSQDLRTYVSRIVVEHVHAATGLYYYDACSEPRDGLACICFRGRANLAVCDRQQIPSGTLHCICLHIHKHETAHGN